MKLTVQEDNNRIDKYIAENTDMTRATVQRMIENGKILVNGKVT